MTKPCVDCFADNLGVPPKSGWRPIDPKSGPRSPRCATHMRARRKRISELAHGRRLESTFRITSAMYWTIHLAQGGRCAICRKATGKSKRLAVDHDHELAKSHDHPVDQACPLCIRGLLCSRCNRWGVPLFLDAVIRAINYLSDPPARKVLATWADRQD